MTVERDVREFLDLRDVDAGRLTAEGSGRVTIRTAPRYEPNVVHVVSGAGALPLQVTADPDGRLTFSVDLGPSHQYEERSPAATALETAGGYWTVRNITITSSP